MKRLVLALILFAAPAWAEGLRFDPYRPSYIAYQTVEGAEQIRYRYSTQVPVTRTKMHIPGIPDGSLVLAYTQTSTILPDSSFRFERTNYNPELFYRMPFDYRWLGESGFGYEHLSSGEDGAMSNGLDYVMAHITIPLFTTAMGGDTLSVSLWVRPRYVIGAEPNTDGMRDLASIAGNDFMPSAGLVVETGGGRYEGTFTRDSVDMEALLKLAALWNFSVYGAFHNGTMEDIATWSADTRSWQVGAGFVW